MNSIDIFFSVIDNFGDAGFAYRFAQAWSRANPLWRVRLFGEGVETLQLIVPEVDSLRPIQSIGSVTIVNSRVLGGTIGDLGTAEFVVETLGCGIPEPYLTLAQTRSRAIINLEALTPEPWAAEYHCKPSMVAPNCAPHYFYMPGYTPTTGGILLDAEFTPPLSNRDRNHILEGVLQRCGSPFSVDSQAFYGTVFTYKRSLRGLIDCARQQDSRIVLFTCGEKSQESMQESLHAATQKSERVFQHDKVSVVFLPLLSQRDYDRLLLACDMNIVRGEDSFARALVSGKPFLWNAYLQKERYHLTKVRSFLDTISPFFPDRSFFEEYRELTLQFNSMDSEDVHKEGNENFTLFFNNLHKLEQSCMEINHFIRSNCDLVRHFSAFLSSIPSR